MHDFFHGSPRAPRVRPSPGQGLTAHLPTLWHVLASLLVWAAFTATPAWAQPRADAPASAPASPDALIDAARNDMEAVRTALDRPLDDDATLQLRKRALAAQTQAQEAATALAPELADVKARLTQLGEVAAGVKESPDVAAERAQLVRAMSTLDSQVKLARLLAVEAEQAAASALANRRSQFSARLNEKSPSVLGARFWQALADTGGRDLPRLRSFRTDLEGRFAAVGASAWLRLAGAVAALLVLQAVMQRALAHLSATRVPSGRLRRSLYAAGVLLVRTLVPGLAAHALLLTLTSGPVPPPPAVAAWLENVAAIVWFGAFVAGLGAALLMPRKPSWRLPPLSDALASALQWFPPALASAIVLGWVLLRTVATLEGSATVTAAAQLAVSLTYVVLLSLALWQAQRVTLAAEAEAAQPGPDEPASAGLAAKNRPLWLSVLRSAAWLALAGSGLALLLGFVTMGTFVVSQVVWGMIVLSAAYVLTVLVDDLFMSLLGPSGPGAEAGPGSEAELSTLARTRHQTAVLLSALCRVAIGLLAAVLLLAPYGEGPLELVQRAGRIHEGLSIGELSVRPLALLQGALVLVIGLGAVRLLKRWLAHRYMPTTRMDAGMRMSVTTLLGYVGSVVVIAVAMSAVGVGLERVAWVASALSVGIGFGLQAVVQNFVSGLILLAERPVKVGDWVSLSGVEGDIRRINVRATEIQMGDRSTVIVPNSEFITKIVRNVTYAESLGMVQFKLPMPLTTDTARARAVLLEAFQAHPGVLDTPAPNVQLDGIDGTNLVLNASGFVSSPRAAYGVKSDLLFDALDRLRVAGLLPGQAPTA